MPDGGCAGSAAMLAGRSAIGGRHAIRLPLFLAAALIAMARRLDDLAGVAGDSAGVRTFAAPDDLDAGPVRIAGHVQHPARPDQAGDGEPGAIRLDMILVQLVYLRVAPPVAQMILRDFPEALVVAADGGLHHVDLLGAGPGVVALDRKLSGGRCLQDRGSRPGQDGGRDCWRPRRGVVGDRRGERHRRGEEHQRRGHQPVRDRLRAAGQRHPGGHPRVPHRGPHLGEDTAQQLQPGQPDDHHQDLQDGVNVELMGEHRHRRHALRDRQPEDGNQPERHARGQGEQGEDGEDPGEHVAGRPARHRGRPAEPRNRRCHQQATPWLMPNSAHAVSCAFMVKLPKKVVMIGLVVTET